MQCSGVGLSVLMFGDPLSIEDDNFSVPFCIQRHHDAVMETDPDRSS